MSDETFESEPLSLGEVRAAKRRQARAWKPRDALVSVLRMLDSGEIDPDTIIIAWLGKKPDDKTPWRPSGQRYAGDSIFETLALCRLTEADILEQLLRSRSP